MNNVLKVMEYNEELKKLSSSFFCGNQYIDNFLKSNESLESDICKTFVLTDDNGEEIIGFFSLCSDAVYENLGTKREHIYYLGGAVRIYMFAIDKKYQDQNIRQNVKLKYASFLLLFCLNMIFDIVSNYIGVTFVVLHSTKEGLKL